jgi:hypothetical protein
MFFYFSFCCSGQVLRQACTLRIIRLGDEILRHAATRTSRGHQWGTQPTLFDLSLIIQAWSDLCIARGRSIVASLYGTRKERHCPACLNIDINLCDVLGAVALGEHSVKQKIGLLMISGDKLSDDHVDAPGRRAEMLRSPRILAELENSSEDDGQSRKFIKLLLLTPGDRPIGPMASDAGGVYKSVSYFKQKYKSHNITGMSATCPEMVEALLKLKERGFIKGVHRHKTGSQQNSNM